MVTGGVTRWGNQIRKYLLEMVNSPLVTSAEHDSATQHTEKMGLMKMILSGILVAKYLCMESVKKEMLREAAEICRLSSLYSDFTREEKREAVMHIYSLIKTEPRQEMETQQITQDSP